VINKLIGSLDSRDGAEKGNTFNSFKGASSPSKNNGSLASSMIGSSLYQISIPDGLESRTYGALYRLLSRRKCIPLGILRGVFSNTKSGPKSNKMPYVYTNPPKDTELFSCDKIFVLSPIPVGLHRIMKVSS
jgi:hypothetical protein